MGYQSLYRKYRPSRMDEVVGQQHVVRMLENSIKKEKISHAYLFCGPRGTGKTSIAKLFARAINCTSETETICGTCDNCIAVQNNTHPDLVEIDAASNNGVDEIRGLIERVKYTPILGKYKVYIIDEVHMLTQGAFNALLKTLEEPPSHVVFILATTEIHKVIPTIISRCQRFDFLRIPNDAIAQRLDYVLEQESVNAEEGATKIIASLSGGGLRNALTILEQAIVLADQKITTEQIYEANGIITTEDKIQLFTSIKNKEMASLLEMMQDMSAQSVHYERLLMDFINGIKDSLVLSQTQSHKFVDAANQAFAQFLSESFSTHQRVEMIETLLNYIEKMRFSQLPETYFEVAMIELIGFNETQSIQQVQPTIRQKEEPIVKEEPKVVEQEEAVAPPQDVEPEIFDEPEEDFEEITEVIHIEPSAPAHQPELSQDLIVQLMVTANKGLRQQDETLFENITNYRNSPDWARSARLLQGGKVVLSGNRFVVVAMSSDVEVRELYEARNQVELKGFAEVIFNNQKTILATTLHQFNEAVESFIKLSSSNQLPEALDEASFFAVQSEQEDIQTDETLDVVHDLFGDAVKIVE